MDKTALEIYNEQEIDKQESNPLERLRSFCCYAMNNQDWEDAGKFFQDVQEAMESVLPSTHHIEHIHIASNSLRNVIARWDRTTHIDKEIHEIQKRFSKEVCDA